jgi:hypothetical protein
LRADHSVSFEVRGLAFLFFVARELEQRKRLVVGNALGLAGLENVDRVGVTALLQGFARTG